MCDALCLHCTELKKAPCVEAVSVVTTVDWAWDFRKDAENRGLVSLSC